MKLTAEWTQDCCGKQDYDADIVKLSTRYWPRGGGFMVFDGAGKFEENADRPHIRPSAHATICLQDHRTALIEQEFEADTEEQVKIMVEAWAQEQFEKVAKAVSDAFGKTIEVKA